MLCIYMSVYSRLYYHYERNCVLQHVSSPDSFKQYIYQTCDNMAPSSVDLMHPITIIIIIVVIVIISHQIITTVT